LNDQGNGGNKEQVGRENWNVGGGKRMSLRCIEYQVLVAWTTEGLIVFGNSGLVLGWKVKSKDNLVTAILEVDYETTTQNLPEPQLRLLFQTDSLRVTLYMGHRLQNTGKRKGHKVVFFHILSCCPRQPLT
jgi:hypothetical protein